MENIQEKFDLAIKNKNIELLLEAIDEGADIDKKDKYDNTTLYRISKLNGYSEIIKILIDKGADVNTRNSDGYDIALMPAIKSNLIENVKLLIPKSKSDINKIYRGVNYTSRPLILASKNGNIKIVELLLEAGADVNNQDENGYTALMHASERGHVEIVYLLLINKADIGVYGYSDYDEITALTLAKTDEIRNLILEDPKVREIRENDIIIKVIIESIIDSGYDSKSFLNFLSNPSKDKFNKYINLKSSTLGGLYNNIDEKYILSKVLDFLIIF